MKKFSIQATLYSRWKCSQWISWTTQNVHYEYLVQHKMFTMNILNSTKCSQWIAHPTQETTWKSSNWLWRQSPTSLATGSKSTSSLNLQTNFTESHICVGSQWSLTEKFRLCIYNVRINCYDYHVLLRPWLAGDSLTFPDFHLWVFSFAPQQES